MSGGVPNDFRAAFITEMAAPREIHVHLPLAVQLALESAGMEVWSEATLRIYDLHLQTLVQISCF